MMKQLQKTVAQNELKKLWVKACEYDGIDQDESFVCFSQDNPHMIQYNKLMSLYLTNKQHQQSLVNRIKKAFPGIKI